MGILLYDKINTYYLIKIYELESENKILNETIKGDKREILYYKQYQKYLENETEKNLMLECQLKNLKLTVVDLIENTGNRKMRKERGLV